VNDRFKSRIFGKGKVPITLEGMHNIKYFCEKYNTGGCPTGWVEICFDAGWLDFVDPNDVILMQCTGLKDKNGTLIYEGDIVKDQDGKIYNIKWNDCYAYFVLWDSDDIEYYTFEEFNLTKLEVIGNIYENPELLGCKNE